MLRDVFFIQLKLWKTLAKQNKTTKNRFILHWWVMKRRIEILIWKLRERGRRDRKPVLFLFQSSLPNTLGHLNKGRALQSDDSVREVVNKWRHKYVLIIMTFSLMSCLMCLGRLQYRHKTIRQIRSSRVSFYVLPIILKETYPRL